MYVCFFHSQSNKSDKTHQINCVCFLTFLGALLINASIHLHLLVFGLIIPSDFGKSVPKSKVTNLVRVRDESCYGHSTVGLEVGSVELIGYNSSTTSQTFSNSNEANKSQSDNTEVNVMRIIDINGAMKNCSHKDDGIDELKELTNTQTSNDKIVKAQHILNTKENTKSITVKGETSTDESLSSLLRNKRVLIHLIAICFANYGHITTYAYIPLLGLEIGLSKSQASAMVSTMAAVNIVGRPFMGFVSDCGLCAKRKGWILALAWGLYGMVVIALAWCSNLIMMMFNVLLIGVCSCEYYICYFLGIVLQLM